MSNERHVLEPDRLVDGGDDVLQISSKRWLPASERDQHGIEEARGVGEGFQLVFFGRWISFPVITEPASGVAAHRYFEVHQYGATGQRQISVLRQKQWYMPRAELIGQHYSPPSIG